MNFNPPSCSCSYSCLSAHEYVPGSSPTLELRPLMFLMIELRFHFARMSKSRSKSKSKRKNQPRNSLNRRFSGQSKYCPYETRKAAATRRKQPPRARHLHSHLHCLFRNGRRLPDRYWIDPRRYHAWNRGYAGRRFAGCRRTAVSDLLFAFLLGLALARPAQNASP